MTIKNVTYHKVFSLGNYENEKIGIEIEVGEGENPVDVLFEAKKYVEKSHLFNQELPKYKRAKDIAADPENYTGHQVKDAQTAVEDFEHNYADYLQRVGDIKSLPAAEFHH